jgi:hypothetical protein
VSANGLFDLFYYSGGGRCLYSITKNATLAKYQERRETRHLRQLRPHKNEKWPLVEERTHARRSGDKKRATKNDGTHQNCHWGRSMSFVVACFFIAIPSRAGARPQARGLFP